MQIELYKKLYGSLVNYAAAMGIDEVSLQRYFYPKRDITSKGILIRLCSSLQNSGRMRNSIKFNDKDTTNRMIIKKVLFDFNTKKSASIYHEWTSIYDAMLDMGIIDKGMKKHTATNWEKYCRGLYDGLQFLTVDNGEKIIADLVATSNMTDKELKELHAISKKIHGLGLSLTCDWLKDCGCTWLAKPDVHIIKVVRYMQSDDKLNEEDVIKEMFSWAQAVKKSGTDKNATADKIDKIIWLLCTGTFYLDDNRIGREAIYRTIDSLR